MNKLSFAVVVAVAMLALSGVSQAQAATTAHPPVPSYSTADTPIGDLLDDPAARAIVEKYLPEVVHGDQIDMARGMSLVAIQPYAPETITDEVLKKIDAELAKLPKPKS